MKRVALLVMILLGSGCGGSSGSGPSGSESAPTRDASASSGSIDAGNALPDVSASDAAETTDSIENAWADAADATNASLGDATSCQVADGAIATCDNPGGVYVCCPEFVNPGHIGCTLRSQFGGSCQPEGSPPQ